jgi:hypothetical protein
MRSYNNWSRRRVVMEVVSVMPLIAGLGRSERPLVNANALEAAILKAPAGT